jgi:hypothetical protein
MQAISLACSNQHAAAAGRLAEGVNIERPIPND